MKLTRMHSCDCANAQVDLSYRCRFYLFIFYPNVATQIITEQHLLEIKFIRTTKAHICNRSIRFCVRNERWKTKTLWLYSKT